MAKFQRRKRGKLGPMISRATATRLAMVIVAVVLIAYNILVLHVLLPSLSPQRMEPEPDHVDELIAWVRSHGGFIHPKIEFRNEVRGDPSTLFGVFAAEDIPEGDRLIFVPNELIVSAKSTYRFRNCDTVELLAEEMRKGADSMYALYAKQLAKTAHDHAALLPAYWSDKGKKMFRQITDNGILPPKDPFMEKFPWKSKCEKVDETATRLILTHGEDMGIVPLTDKFNNRGGPWLGAEYDLHFQDSGLAVDAYRDLKAGEQIYTDYKDYGQIGTPELLKDYGFVESQPQRWIFPVQSIAFDLFEQTDGQLGITWNDDVRGEHYDNSEKDVRSLGKHLERLKLLCPELEKSDGIPQVELNSIGAFCRNMESALEVAVADNDASSD